MAATSDLMLAYVDFFLGGDEKRAGLHLHQRFPMSIIFGGDGSYMAPFSLQSDNILTSLMSQVCYLFLFRVVFHVKFSSYWYLNEKTSDYYILILSVCSTYHLVSACSWSKCSIALSTACTLKIDF